MTSPKPSVLALSALFISASLLGACSEDKSSKQSFILAPADPVTINTQVQTSTLQRLNVDLDNPQSYASLSVYAGDRLLAESLDIAVHGRQQLNTLLQFNSLGEKQLRFVSNNAKLTIYSYELEPVAGLEQPQFKDISERAGIDKANSLKYAGPTIADIDMDGDYDFIVNNHNDVSSKLYWNNGDGTVSKHSVDLARWYMHDLHGTAAGDYDNDGDLDLVVTQGGGNGMNPSENNFYLNQNNNFVLYTGDVGIDRGGRGRGARWSDMDLDGDLDLLLFNEASLYGYKPQHFFYENLGNGKLAFKHVPGLEDLHQSRVLLTDFNSDGIDDLIFYGPVSLWQSNGDFSFSDVSHKLPEAIKKLPQVMAMSDIDIDNDGDLDLFLARGKLFEGGQGETPSMDFDPQTKLFSIKPRGFKGVDRFRFSADGDVLFHNYYYLAQGGLIGKDYPVFLGADKNKLKIANGEQFTLSADQAQGWPEEHSENGMYFGYLGDKQWQAALVRNGNIFWGFQFSLSGVSSVTPDFVPQNRNEADYLLRNDGDTFVDVSRAWNIPAGTNALGVTNGDFNNDGLQDLFVYRWGKVGAKSSDYLLLNRDARQFETVTMHGANDIGGPGNGDMGQAFDFDLDGDLDLLNGSENGQWYLYENSQPGSGNYALVRVAYAPKSGIDALSAQVSLKTANNSYTKRVGSAGEVFSQSLLNTVHFGLGNETKIEQIKIRWRNGEEVEFNNKQANQLFDSNKLDPQKLQLNASRLREGATAKVTASFEPAAANSDLHWHSSQPNIIHVDQNGELRALGKAGQSAQISAQSSANGLQQKIDVLIEPWTKIELQDIYFDSKKIKLYSGESMQLNALLAPTNADVNELQWTSSNEQVASVNSTGTISALSPGQTSIAVFSPEYPQLKAQLELTVENYQEPYIKIRQRSSFEDNKLKNSGELHVVVDYHAGSGNKVIFSDEGGVRFWLRHFRSKWFPVKDVVLVDASALGNESGVAEIRIPLEQLTPTAELPEGHFYQLRASFINSEGQALDDVIYPLEFVK
ncbi:FG-GAP-like repeat-containing protein [Agaribacterium haliotis]|uniref:FG-GAP-like repeat-containing protein n=1 Tax=Agaribacterium haliotis TaxID=2013869 RepID=UPI000BB52EF2|nr:FG-GAP-like repeat-containing protein [Agaribacterium haliotis]